MHAYGNVISEDRQVKLLVQDAEVLLDLTHAAERVERGSCHEGVDAELLGHAAMLDHAIGLGVDDAHEHRDAVVDDADSFLDDLIAALIGGEHDLT